MISRELGQNLLIARDMDEGLFVVECVVECSSGPFNAVLIRDAGGQRRTRSHFERLATLEAVQMLQADYEPGPSFKPFSGCEPLPSDGPNPFTSNVDFTGELLPLHGDGKRSWTVLSAKC